MTDKFYAITTPEGKKIATERLASVTGKPWVCLGLPSEFKQVEGSTMLAYSPTAIPGQLMVPTVEGYPYTTCTFEYRYSIYFTPADSELAKANRTVLTTRKVSL